MSAVKHVWRLTATAEISRSIPAVKCAQISSSLSASPAKMCIRDRILRIHDTSDKSEIVRNQFRTLVHDENAAGIELKALFVICGEIVERRTFRYEEESVERRKAFHAVMNRSQRLILPVEFFLIELRILFICNFAPALLPERHHAVERFDISVGFKLVVLSAFFLSALFHFHLDRISDVVGIFLYEIAELIIEEIVVEVIVLSIVLDVKNDSRTCLLYKSRCV